MQAHDLLGEGGFAAFPSVCADPDEFASSNKKATEPGVHEQDCYEDEGHGLAKLKNRLDAYPRIAAFLYEHLGAPG